MSLTPFFSVLPCLIGDTDGTLICRCRGAKSTAQHTWERRSWPGPCLSRLCGRSKRAPRACVARHRVKASTRPWPRRGCRQNGARDMPPASRTRASRTLSQQTDNAHSLSQEQRKRTFHGTKTCRAKHGKEGISRGFKDSGYFFLISFSSIRLSRQQPWTVHDSQNSPSICKLQNTAPNTQTYLYHQITSTPPPPPPPSQTPTPPSTPPAHQHTSAPG